MHFTPQSASDTPFISPIPASMIFRLIRSRARKKMKPIKSFHYLYYRFFISQKMFYCQHIVSGFKDRLLKLSNPLVFLLSLIYVKAISRARINKHIKYWISLFCALFKFQILRSSSSIYYAAFVIFKNNCIHLIILFSKPSFANTEIKSLLNINSY